VSDQRADAHDRVVDVLWESVPEKRPQLRVGLTDEAVSGCEPAQVGHSLQVPDDDGAVHGSEHGMRQCRPPDVSPRYGMDR
jgi:hypothetical protein